MNKGTGLFIVYFLLMLGACQTPTGSKMPDDESIEKLFRENPDSLAIVLEEKIHPDDLPEKEKARYAWWLAKVHVAQGRSLVNDTLIHYAVDYYKKMNSPRLPEAYLLAAEQINREGTGSLKKEHVLKEALQAAEEKRDTAEIQTICRHLSEVYQVCGDTGKMKALIKTTKKYAGISGNADAYINLADQFSYLGQADSVLFYAGKGMELAQEHTVEVYNLTRTYIEALNVTGQSRKALEMLPPLEKSPFVRNEIKFNYISTWLNKGETDSAQVYVDALQSLIEEYKSHYPGNMEVNMLEATLGMFRIIVEAKQGKPLALKSIAAPVNAMVDISREKIKTDREQQFVRNKLVREKYELEIERANLKERLLWTVIGLLICIAFLVFVYQYKLLRKERFVQQTKEQLRIYTIRLSENESVIHKNEELIRELSAQPDDGEELKQEINTLMDENELLKQRNRKLQEDMEYYSKSIDKKEEEITAYEKLAEENLKLQERNRFLTSHLISHTKELDWLGKKPSYIEKSQWQEIQHTINKLFNGFSHRLHGEFPVLTEEDIFYCCLLKLHLSTSVISTLMGISPSSVTKRKQRIKEKMFRQQPAKIHKEQPLEMYLWNY